MKTFISHGIKILTYKKLQNSIALKYLKRKWKIEQNNLKKWILMIIRALCYIFGKLTYYFVIYLKAFISSIMSLFIKRLFLPNSYEFLRVYYVTTFSRIDYVLRWNTF